MNKSDGERITDTLLVMRQMCGLMGKSREPSGGVRPGECDELELAVALGWAYRQEVPAHGDLHVLYEINYAGLVALGLTDMEIRQFLG